MPTYSNSEYRRYNRPPCSFQGRCTYKSRRSATHRAGERRGIHTFIPGPVRTGFFCSWLGTCNQQTFHTGLIFRAWRNDLEYLRSFEQDNQKEAITMLLKHERA